MSTLLVAASAVAGGIAGTLTGPLVDRWSAAEPQAEQHQRHRDSRTAEARGVGEPGRVFGPVRVTRMYPVLGAATCTLLALRPPTQGRSQMLVLAAWLVLACAGVILSAMDIATHRLPTPAIAATGAAVAVLVAGAAFTESSGRLALAALAGCLFCGGLYLAIALVSRARMGLGDVRLAALLGLGLGMAGPGSVVIGVLAPFVLAMPTAFVLLARGRTGEAELPFGPFLVGGAVLAVSL
ncbi:peptidase A24 [Longispora sp. NPDC051575]|uniref:peptidase A24 n=1 Tax=Longispora sp. NPDC051575 TaxID=3154943 RepID=UPI003418873E